jgi:hypothetical protein
VKSVFREESVSRSVGERRFWALARRPRAEQSTFLSSGTVSGSAGGPGPSREETQL